MIRVFAGLTLWWTVLEVSLVLILVDNVFGLLAIVFALLRELPFSGGLLSTVTSEDHSYGDQRVQTPQSVNSNHSTHTFHSLTSTSSSHPSPTGQ